MNDSALQQTTEQNDAHSPNILHFRVVLNLLSEAVHTDVLAITGSIHRKLPFLDRFIKLRRRVRFAAGAGNFSLHHRV
jgi:hypothetical protein